MGGLDQEIQDRAHDLGLTAKTIGILHARIADEMGFANLTPGHERAQRLGGALLAAMAAQTMDTRIERRVRAACGVG